MIIYRHANMPTHTHTHTYMCSPFLQLTLEGLTCTDSMSPLRRKPGQALLSPAALLPRAAGALETSRRAVLLAMPSSCRGRLDW